MKNQEPKNVKLFTSNLTMSQNRNQYVYWDKKKIWQSIDKNHNVYHPINNHEACKAAGKPNASSEEKSITTYQEITKMVELDKDIKTDIITALHVFKKLERRLNMFSGDMEYKKYIKASN